jgi:hypothetical protein
MFLAVWTESERVTLIHYVVINYKHFHFFCSQNVANSDIFQSTCRVLPSLLFSGSKLYFFRTITKYSEK